MLERYKNGDKEYLVGFHTQEYRAGVILEKPIKCLASNAWLGQGYYFWVEEIYAKYWGEDFKTENTGYYDIYEGRIDDENFINATFSEEGYYFFKEKIENSIQHLKNSGIEVTLEKVHRFLVDKIWPRLNITGIVYDDLPHNVTKKDRIYSEVKPLYYNKRIQVVVFNENNIVNFAPRLQKQSNKN